MSPVPSATTGGAASSVTAPAPSQATEPSELFTPIPSLTPTLSGPSVTIATTGTPTGTPATVQATGTLPLTATATVLESVSLDKLPRDTVYKRVRIDNETHSQMDISLHCTTHQGLQTVLEYSGVKHLTIEAPECDYIYVVYVGGHLMTGGFSLYHVANAAIAVYADRVAVH